MMLTKQGYDDQLAQYRKLSESDAFASKKDKYMDRDHSNDLAITSYNNRMNDKGWKEVIDLERSLKRDTQLRYR